MSKPVVLRAFIEVINRLSRLATSREQILEVIDAAVSAAAESTPNDPAGTKGWRRWQMGTRRLRETHVGLGGWEKDDRDQIASVVNDGLGLRIVVCNTDDGTCIENKKPRNSSKKGSATERAIDANQSSFMSILDESVASIVQIRRDENRLMTYALCIYHNGDDIRAELSCAIETVDGFISDFSERIFIIGGESGKPDLIKRKGSDDGDGDEPDFDIPVTRKK